MPKDPRKIVGLMDKKSIVTKRRCPIKWGMTLKPVGHDILSEWCELLPPRRCDGYG